MGRQSRRAKASIRTGHDRAKRDRLLKFVDRKGRSSGRVPAQAHGKPPRQDARLHRKRSKAIALSAEGENGAIERASPNSARCSGRPGSARRTNQLRCHYGRWRCPQARSPAPPRSDARRCISRQPCIGNYKLSVTPRYRSGEPCQTVIRPQRPPSALWDSGVLHPSRANSETPETAPWDPVCPGRRPAAFGRGRADRTRRSEPSGSNIRL